MPFYISEEIMNNWETSRIFLEKMAVREQKIAELRQTEEKWYDLEDLSSPEAFSLMVEWTKQQIHSTGTKGLVIGVSGGVDSTLGALIVKHAIPEQTIALLIPSGSGGEDADDALKIVKLLDLPYRIIDIEPVVKNFINTTETDLKPGVYGNIVSRIRNAVMYAEANSRGYLVLGTGDLDEAYIGYSTKGTTSDLFVTNGLHKWEVKKHVKRELGRYDSGFAEHIIEKPSTPGYHKGHNAEDDIGISYNKIAVILDLIMEHCEIFKTGILPADPAVFEKAIAERNLSHKDVVHVEELIIGNYHKGFGSPTK
jgi:NAD+ synthase